MRKQSEVFGGLLIHIVLQDISAALGPNTKHFAVWANHSSNT